MPPSCKKCQLQKNERPVIHKAGFYYRTSDKKWIQRFHCVGCGLNFSKATHQPCYRQKKRHKNEPLRQLLSSGVSQRRASILLKIHRNTTVRKFLFLALQSQMKLQGIHKERAPVTALQFDDLETFEHSKLKPLSVTLAVENKTRKILAFEVSSMPAKGRPALIARARYGQRWDGRKKARERLFTKLGQLVTPTATIHSDCNPHYEKDVKRFFPLANHLKFKGRRGAITAQGELKKIGFDPLFSLNHTCAMLRANINRLFRKTWCTTKKKERLYAHLTIYALYHNETLL